MSDDVLRQLEAIIQRDVNNRGLATYARENLLTACAGDFVQTCHSLAAADPPVVAIVTGFYIPAANAGETDGPLGALFLARALRRMGGSVIIFSEQLCAKALESAARGLTHEGEYGIVSLTVDDGPVQAWEESAWLMAYMRRMMLDVAPRTTHLIAIERAGPSHSPRSIQAQHRRGHVPLDEFLAQVPEEHFNQYHTMRGQVISGFMEPAHRLFEFPDAEVRPVTIGIGDGGNEIGMGKIPWEVIARNVPGGGLVACRVPTDYNIVCGVSNWGAYALAAGVWHLRGRPLDPAIFSAEAERQLWEKVLQQAVLVDGITGQRTLTVDGLSWDDYIRPLEEIVALLGCG